MEMEAAVMVEGTQVEVAREEAALVAVAMGVEEGQVAPTVATVAVAMRVEVMAAAETAEVAAASTPRPQTHHSPDPCSSSPQSRPRRVARLCSQQPQR